MRRRYGSEIRPAETLVGDGESTAPQHLRKLGIVETVVVEAYLGARAGRRKCRVGHDAHRAGLGSKRSGCESVRRKEKCEAEDAA